MESEEHGGTLHVLHQATKHRCSDTMSKHITSRPLPTPPRLPSCFTQDERQQTSSNWNLRLTVQWGCGHQERAIRHIQAFDWSSVEAKQTLWIRSLITQHKCSHQICKAMILPYFLGINGNIGFFLLKMRKWVWWWCNSFVQRQCLKLTKLRNERSSFQMAPRESCEDRWGQTSFMRDVVKGLDEISRFVDFLQTHLSKPGEGIWHGALHCEAEADIMSHHHFIDGFHLIPVARIANGSVDALKVPTLKETIKTWRKWPL